MKFKDTKSQPRIILRPTDLFDFRLPPPCKWGQRSSWFYAA